MKTRLDQLLVDRGLAESRERAQALIRAGLVLVGEQLTDKPGAKIDDAATVRIKGEVCPYVSRGGIKLLGALRDFGLTGLTGAGTGVGSCSIEFEALDSVTGERLAAGVSKRVGDKFTGKFDKFDQWSAAKNSFDYWSALFKTRLIELQAGIRP